MRSLLKISQQTFWQVLGKVITSLATFVVLAMVARNYGEAGTGIYTLAVTYFAIFFIFADFGFNAHILRKIKNQKSKIKKEWQKLLGARIMWSLVLVGLALGLLPFLPFATDEFARSVILSALAILVYAVFVTCNLIFQAHLRYELSTIATSVGAFAWLFMITWFIQLKLSVPFLVLSHFLGWIVITFSALVLLKKLLKTLNPEFNLGYTKKLFKDSWPIAATLAVNVIYFRADTFIISYFKGVGDAGIYNVAYQIFQSVLVLPTFIMNSFYPIMVTTLRSQFTHFLRQIRLATAALLLISLALALIFYIISPFLIHLITGGGFLGATLSLQILTFSFPAYFLSSLFMWVMIARRMYKKMVLVYSIGLIFNILVNMLFIPQHSYIAAAWVTGASEYLILGMQVGVLLFEKNIL